LPNGVDLATGYRRVHSLEELFEQSDAISLHAPYHEGTHHLINQTILAHAKAGLILINTARGPLIDLDALYTAMKSGAVAGAGLDVLPQEPPTPLPALLAEWSAGDGWIKDRLLITPHAAFFSPPGNLDIRRKASEVVCHYLRDGTLNNCVNWEAIKSHFRK
jgi:phosphoglycerate dehydrogenase-like enzyme